MGRTIICIYICITTILIMRATASSTYADVYESNVVEKITEYRRQIHRRPELMYEEYETSALVERALLEMGVSPSNIMGTAITGLVAHLGAGSLETSLASGPAYDGSRPSSDGIPTIVLRADMDALPILEETPIDFRSEKDGVMHACGHDTHTAMLLGAAMALKAREADLVAMNGAVRLFFQPAEEGGTGARRALVEGALNGATAAGMLHTNPEYEVGVIASKPGAIMAAEAELIIRVIGEGGHGAYPHTTRDPLLAATAIVSALNSIVSRRLEPWDAGVISVTMISTNSAKHNIIPGVVEMRGTMRALSFEVMDFLIANVEERAAHVAASYGCAVEIGPWLDTTVHQNSRGEEWSTPARLPPVVNDAAMVSLGLRTYESIFPNSTIRMEEAHMTGEDFSFLSDAMPSVFAWIGHRTGSHETDRTATNLHNSMVRPPTRTHARTHA